MRCPRCQVDTPQPHRFCDQCEIPLEACCPQCEAALRSAAKFCGGRGHRLPGPEATALARAVSPEPAAAAHCRLVPYTPQHLTDKVLRGRAALQRRALPGHRPVYRCTDEVGFSPLALQLDPAAIHTIHYGRVL